MRRLFSLVLAAALLFAVLPASVSASPGSCALADNGNYKIWVGKGIADVVPAASYFDYVGGEVTVRDLNSCGSTAKFTSMGSFVMAANLQTSSGGIIQMGYGKFGGAATLQFFWVNGNNGAPIVLTGFEAPQLNHVYRMTMSRASNGDKVYSIQDLTDGQAAYTWTRPGWLSGFTTAWWACETLDNFSEHGVTAGESPFYLNQMSYSGNTSSTVYYRSGLTNANVAYDFVTSTHHGYISGTVVGGDTFNCYTD